MKKKVFAVLIALLCSSIFATQIFGGAAFLTWDSPTTNADGTPLTDLARYRLYWGTVSGTYTNSFDVPTCVACPAPTNPINEVFCLGSFPRGQTLYLAVTAIDTSNNESAYSNEVFKTMPAATNPLGNIDTVSIGSANRVDGFDLIKLSAKFGKQVITSCLLADWYDAAAEISDLNYDGRVDGFDLIILSANFGKTV